MSSPKFAYPLLRGSLLVLPYASYGGLIGLIGLIGSLLIRHRRSPLDPITQNGLWGIVGLMLLSSLLAENRAEALLQLANFLPFFLLFAVLPFLLDRLERLEQLATDWVIAALPISIFALVEYILKAEFIPRSLRSFPPVHWARHRPHAGRAMAMFAHPNALASYLVLLFGLGLGLILFAAMRQRLKSFPSGITYPVASKTKFMLLSGATAAHLLGIFASGSRNGLVIAILQLLGFGILWAVLLKVNRRVLSISALGIGVLLIGAAGLGIGGRSLAVKDWVNDPRFRLWWISLDLLQKRPWFGWGLGNYKFQFPDRLLALYPSCAGVRSRRIIPVECADVTHAHNFWITLAVEGGILLAIALTVWVGYICWRAVKALWLRQIQSPQNALLLGYLFAFSGCIAFAFFDVTLYDARVNTLDWVILSGIYCLSRPLFSPSQIAAKD